jgi:arylsulfatase A-like enzyme
MRQPFFVYAHYMETHAPYDPPSPHRNAFGPLPELTSEDRKLVDNYVESYIDRVLFEVGLTRARKFANVSKAGEEYVACMYDGEALFLDTEVARLIGYIRANVPNTVIVFTADHGEELWDHGSIGHGKTVYEELTHVPLIIHVPGRTPRVIAEPVESIDILPTMAGLLGLEERPWWQGRDLAFLLDVLPPDHPSYSSTQMSIPGSNVDLECVVVNELKLIVDLKEARGGGLFDLSRDPKEVGPPLDSSAAIQGLERLLTDRRAFNQDHPRFQTTPARVGLDEETADALRAQGYAAGVESNNHDSP